MRILGARSLPADRAARTLLDVRERGEFALGHIPDALPLPRGWLELRLERLIQLRHCPLVLYCDDGRRSQLAAETVARMGYADVAVLEGGFNTWRAGGRPVVEGWGVGGKTYGERVLADEHIPQIEAADLARRLRDREKLVVLDARSEQEYELGHLPGAYSVPGGVLPLAVEAFKPAETTIVVNCAGRTRSILGAQALRRVGVPHVYALRNGIMAWLMAGEQVATGPGEQVSWRVDVALQRLTRELASAEGIQPITVAQVQRIEAKYLVDVRQPREYLAGHVPGSASLPGGQLALVYENVIGLPDVPIVTISHDGVRDVWAASLLKHLGFANVRPLAGGVQGWPELEVGEPPEPASSPAGAQPVSELGDALIVDVRSAGEFAQGHVAGSRWIARGSIELQAHDVLPNKQAAVITVCDTGARSALAAGTLKAIGYECVSFLEGGLKGQPLVTGLEGANVPREVAQGDIGFSVWSGPLAKTEGEMKHYLDWEEALTSSTPTRGGSVTPGAGV